MLILRVLNFINFDVKGKFMLTKNLKFKRLKTMILIKNQRFFLLHSVMLYKFKASQKMIIKVI